MGDDTQRPTFRATRHSREVLIADWRDAEEFAAWHMANVLGIAGGTITAAGPDGGIDVIAPTAAAQVKHYGGAVGAPEVQQARGAGFAKEHVLFYALSGYTAAATRAAEVGVVLFTYNVYGEAQAANALAERLIASASPPSQHSGAAAEEASAARAGTYLDPGVVTLFALVDADQNAAEMPLRSSEDDLLQGLFDRMYEGMESLRSEQHFTLEAYDFEEGPDDDLRWYEAAGGPPELPELHDRTFDLEGELLTVITSSFSHFPRGEAVEFTRGYLEKYEGVLAEWKRLRDTLPESKLGKAWD